MKPIKIIKKFRSSGQRVTSQRLAIMRVLDGNTSHPTAEEIHRSLKKEHPTITLATVYQTLKVLRDAGEIRELNMDRGRSHYDPDTSQHHHAVCTGCGRVQDVQGPSDLRIPSGKVLEDDFDVMHYQVAFYGRCAVCKRRKQQARNR